MRFCGRIGLLQLWAAAEPGKVIEGLTVKQEISAIREALNSDDQEFMSQYGGMNQAADRYMELLKLPEAERFRKGSRLTVIRRTGPRGFRSRFEGPNPGCFSCSNRPHAYLFQGQKGGVEHKKAVGAEHPHIP